MHKKPPEMIMAKLALLIMQEIYDFRITK